MRSRTLDDCSPVLLLSAVGPRVDRVMGGWVECFCREVSPIVYAKFVKSYRRPTSMTATVIGGTGTVAALLPSFLTSAMAVQISKEFAFGSAGLGLAIAAFRLGGAATSVPLGRVADRVGAIRTVRMASLVAAITALGIAVTANGLMSLTLWLAIGGSAMTMANPGANRLLTATVNPSRLGTAFGLKQSAPPIAAMLSGAAVPVIAVTIGWRWGFALAALGALAFALSLKPPARSAVVADVHNRYPKLRNRRLIVLLATAFGLGTSTSATVTTFYVTSAVAAGTTPERAGVVLLVASLATIGSRILSGMVSDRLSGGQLTLCAGLMASGSIGIAMLSSGSEILMTAGVGVALVGSWGFNGVFWFALLQAYPTAPGRVTGAVSPGGLIGSTVGPLAFGVIAERVGFGSAWASLAVVATISAAVMLHGSRRLRVLQS